MLADSENDSVFELLKEAINAIFIPTIHFPSLPKGLEILAHVALLASKLSQEITRILRLEVDAEYPAGLPLDLMATMRGELAEVETALWETSLELRRIHVARSLTAKDTNMAKVKKMIKLYFTRPMVDTAGPSERKPQLGAEANLFIRAMPSRLEKAFDEYGDQVGMWYEVAVEKKGRDTKSADPPWQPFIDLTFASTITQSTTRVFDLIERVQKIMVEATAQIVVPEIKGEALSPESERVSKLPRIAYESSTSRRRISRGRITVTRSSTPQVHFDSPTARLGLGLRQGLDHRTTSMQETEAMLVVMKDDSIEPTWEVDTDNDVQIRRHPASDNRLDRDQSRARTSTEVKPRPRTSTDPVKKRSRPSFPPREGPDYTRPLPTASPAVRSSRLHNFQTKDMRR